MASERKLNSRVIINHLLLIIDADDLRLPMYCLYGLRIVLCAALLRLQLKELNHDNIKAFVGACTEPGHICYLMHCCSRGTVQVSKSQ